MSAYFENFGTVGFSIIENPLIQNFKPKSLLDSAQCSSKVAFVPAHLDFYYYILFKNDYYQSIPHIQKPHCTKNLEKICARSRVMASESFRAYCNRYSIP